jgi:GNAT superfamily N-acetyltransferase
MRMYHERLLRIRSTLTRVRALREYSIIARAGGPGQEETTIEIIATTRLDGRGAAGLERIAGSCESFDGVSVLEMEKSLNAHPDMPSFFLAYEGEALLGILSVFAPRSDEAELGALVHPAMRRKGVFSALLAASEAALKDYGYSEELFVVDGRSAPGAAVAAALGAHHEFTEYAMLYTGKAPRPGATGLEIVRLGMESFESLVELRRDAFDGSREDAESFERATFASPGREQYGAFVDGGLIGACSLGFEGAKVSVNGLVVAEAQRGRGYGQAFLGLILENLSGRSSEIVLDVNSRNESAFHIYKKMGFQVSRSVEYHRRRLS